ncbi:manganese efflux pump MntP family protein [Spirochaetota bacterium]
MNIIIIIGIAISLAMDALAVSIANGCYIEKIHVKHAFRIAFFFGLFQAIMPFIGWLGGLTLYLYIASIDHWIAFGLLAFIGIKMLIESRKPRSERKNIICIHFPTLLLLSLATSIDALAAGLSFGVMNVSIFLPVVIIGGITFVLCFIGIYAGDKFGKLTGNKLDIAGGVILIGIGIKIFIEHLIKGI